MNRVLAILLVLGWLLLLAALPFALSGCDYEVDRQPQGDPTITQGEVSCTHPGFCSCCKPVFSMNNGIDVYCGYGSCDSCPGRQIAEIETQPILVIYKSGKTRALQSERKVRELTECK
jgi:hypothetical protein